MHPCRHDTRAAPRVTRRSDPLIGVLFKVIERSAINASTCYQRGANRGFRPPTKRSRRPSCRPTWTTIYHHLPPSSTAAAEASTRKSSNFHRSSHRQRCRVFASSETRVPRYGEISKTLLCRDESSANGEMHLYILEILIAGRARRGLMQQLVSFTMRLPLRGASHGNRLFVGGSRRGNN